MVCDRSTLIVDFSLEVRAAADRFRAFFQELGRVFVEREDVLAQIALDHLSNECQRVVARLQNMLETCARLRAAGAEDPPASRSTPR